MLQHKHLWFQGHGLALLRMLARVHQYNSTLVLDMGAQPGAVPPALLGYAPALAPML